MSPYVLIAGMHVALGLSCQHLLTAVEKGLRALAAAARRQDRLLLQRAAAAVPARWHLRPANISSSPGVT